MNVRYMDVWLHLDRHRDSNRPGHILHRHHWERLGDEMNPFMVDKRFAENFVNWKRMWRNGCVSML